ncbi:hypothetical protein [Nostoc sp.]
MPLLRSLVLNAVLLTPHPLQLFLVPFSLDTTESAHTAAIGASEY